ncbi:hypothetical protein, partial [Idiomarina fontislapidosi]|uniref:hypothetical protein n=1 Tax=Idiomarina fontislapidosi TaxID=263723 RepID=UPI001A7E1592
MKKVLDALAKGCRIRIPASGTKQRSLTIYQAKQTVWALAKVSNKEILQLLNECLATEVASTRNS